MQFASTARKQPRTDGAHCEVRGGGGVELDWRQLEPGDIAKLLRGLSFPVMFADAAFREGRARIQDEGSQLVGELAAGAGAGGTERLKTFLTPARRRVERR